MILLAFHCREKQWQLKDDIAETHGPRSNRSQFEAEFEVAHNQPSRLITPGRLLSAQLPFCSPKKRKKLPDCDTAPVKEKKFNPNLNKTTVAGKRT